MKMDRERRSIIFFTILSVVILITISFQNVKADVEPNDSLDHPELYEGGTVIGSVEEIINWTYPYQVENIDRDIYRMDIPPLSILEVSLKKMDSSTDTIRMESFDENRTQETYQIHGSVDIPGQVDKASLKNSEGRAIHFYLMITGTGNYSLTTQIKEIEAEEPEEPPEREEQWHQFYDAPEIISDGIFKDHLDQGTYRYPSRHYYLVTVPEGKKLTLNLEKTDEEKGTIYLDTVKWDNRYGTTDSIFLHVDEIGENISDSWNNYRKKDVDILIEVQGVGEYKLIVNTTEDADPNTEAVIIILILLISVVMILLSMLLSILLPIIIIIIIIMAVTRKPKGTKRKEIAKVKSDFNEKKVKKNL